MNIAQIRYFVTAAQVQNLSKAAELLHLSQPALSKSIAKLEEELGTPLFIRSGKRITLNEQGKRFLEGAWVSLRTLDNMMADLNALTMGAPSRICVGVYQADALITEHLVAYARLHPEVELDINCFIGGREDPDINKYDMLVYPSGSRYDRFRSYYLRDEHYLLAVPAKHPLAAKKSVSLEDLHGQPFVFMSQGKLAVEEPYYLCAGLNLRIKALYNTNTQEQHRLLVSSGVALGFVAEGCAGAYREDKQICLKPIHDNKFHRRVMVCFRRSKHLSAAGRDFERFMIHRLGLRETREENGSG